MSVVLSAPASVHSDDKKQQKEGACRPICADKEKQKLQKGQKQEEKIIRGNKVKRKMMRESKRRQLGNHTGLSKR